MKRIRALSCLVGLILVGDISRQDANAQGRTSSSIVATASALEFHSDFWMNLHHALHAAARGVRLENITLFAFSPAEQKIWDSAVEVYRSGYARKDLLFDRDMMKIKIAIGQSADNPNSTGIPKDLRMALQEAAPIYRERVWATADAANRTWIAEQIRNIQQLAPAETSKLASLFGTPWPTSVVRVDAVRVANPQGAYTSFGPSWIVISTGDPNNQNWAGTEVVFHESSHLLVRPVSSAIEKAAKQASVEVPDVLWHVVLFYIAGEVTRQALLREGVMYEPYLYKTGLFDRAWPTMKKPIETVLPDYITGLISLDDTANRLVAALRQ
jgi:hypothetical protein